MDIKRIVDIEALSGGWSVAMAKVGSIIPIAGINFLEARVGPMVPSPEYTAPLVAGFFDVWRIGTAVYK